MSAPTMPTADWSGANLTTFRRDYVRDLVDTTTNPFTYYSHYNRATKAQFFTDAAINAIKNKVETDFAEELTNVYNTKYNERLLVGDASATADTMAGTVLLDATMRLVRAECYERLMADPGFIGSVADKDERKALIGIWADLIARDRTFERVRSGSFASIPVVRL